MYQQSKAPCVPTAPLRSKHYGRSLVFGARLEDGDLPGEVSLARMNRHIRKMHAESALAVARRKAHPVQTAPMPRRHGKHVLDMPTKGFGPQYQGLDDNGRPIWGHSTTTAVAATVAAAPRWFAVTRAR